MPYNIPTMHRIEEIKKENRKVKTFIFHSKKIAKESNPGQFLMIWNPKVDEIPISIADVSKGRIEITIADSGECTHSLHQKKKGDYIGIRGPYGRGFSLYRERICMVGGGYGIAPLRYAARKAIREKRHVIVLEGAKNSSELLDADMFLKMSCDIKVATEDGSRGYKGTVTELLSEVLKEERVEQVLICGPESMMEKVYEIVHRRRIPAQILVERIIKCACGACGSCDIGGYRVCKEGPVFDAEKIYEKTEFGRWKRGKSGKRIPLVEGDSFLLSSPFPEFTPVYEPLLATGACGLKFPNPVMNAAGFGLSGKLLCRYAVAGAGAVVTKTVGLEEREGFPNPSFFEISEDNYVNAMGLPNPGIKNYRLDIEDAAPSKVPLILSIFGRSPEECKEAATIALSYKINMIELNISCPHTELETVENDLALVKYITKGVTSVAHSKRLSPKRVPVSVKISPNTKDPTEVARAAVKGKADAVTAINTQKIRPLSTSLNIPILGNPTGYGGGSGRKLALLGKRIVFELYEVLNVPIIAVGGIFSYVDIIEYAMNGASLFQIGSVLVKCAEIGKFEIFEVIKKGLRKYLLENGYKNISELVGAAHS